MLLMWKRSSYNFIKYDKIDYHNRHESSIKIKLWKMHHQQIQSNESWHLENSQFYIKSHLWIFWCHHLSIVSVSCEGQAFSWLCMLMYCEKIYKSHARIHTNKKEFKDESLKTPRMTLFWRNELCENSWCFRE